MITALRHQAAAAVGGQHHAGLRVQQSGQDRRAARGEVGSQVRRHGTERPGEDIGEHQVVGGPGAHHGLPARGHPAMHLPAQPVQPRVLRRHPHGPGVAVGGQHGPVQQPRRRHRQDAGAAAQVQDAPRLAVQHPLERPQAAARGTVLAGAECHPGVQHQRGAARHMACGQVCAADDEAAPHALLGKRRFRPGKPSAHFGRPPLQHGRLAGEQGGQQQPGLQFPVGMARCPHALHRPDAPGLIRQEQADRVAGQPERRLEPLKSMFGNGDRDGFEFGHPPTA